MATVTLVLALLGLLSVPVELAVIPGYEQRALVVCGAALLLGFAYWLARSGRWRLGGTVAAAVPPMAVGLVLYLEPKDAVAPYAVLFGVLVAAVFLRPPHAALFALATNVWLGTILWLVGRSMEDVIALVLYCATFSALQVAAGTYRAYMVAAHRAAVQEEERRRAEAQRMEALGRVAGGIAHDFNNLLAVVGLNASLLAEKLAPEDKPLLDDVNTAVQHGKELIGSLLAFARRGPLEPELVDVKAAIEDVVALLRRVVGRQVAIDVEVAGKPTVFAPPAQLRQLVMNLVLNARDAMPQGGQVMVRAGVDPVGPWLSVSDTGTGMSPEVVRRVFEPFFSTRQQGTGIGLAIVKDVVTRAAGRVELDTVPGRGTTFTCHFPLPDGQPSTSRSQVSP